MAFDEKHLVEDYTIPWKGLTALIHDMMSITTPGWWLLPMKGIVLGARYSEKEDYNV